MRNFVPLTISYFCVRKRKLKNASLIQRCLYKIKDLPVWFHTSKVYFISNCSDKKTSNICIEPAQSTESVKKPSSQFFIHKGPTPQQLRLVFITSCIPFIGFGFVDNFFMILLGDYLDTTLCVWLGFSTLAAAGLGNLVSDLLGIKLGERIERATNRLKYFQPHLTELQIHMPQTRRCYYSGCAFGMALGCLLGMVPLLFLDTEEAERLKTKKAQETLFGKLTSDMAACLKAETVNLYIVEKKPLCQITNPSNFKIIQTKQPFYNYLKNYIMPSIATCGCHNKVACPNVPISFLSQHPETGIDIRIDISTGIPGKVFSSKKVIYFRNDLSIPPVIIGSAIETLPSSLLNWSPYDFETYYKGVLKNNYTNLYSNLHHNVQLTHLKYPISTTIVSEYQIIGVPVFGIHGDVIGVIVVKNPIDKPSFTRNDKELILTMASHIAIEIQGKQHITHILSMCNEQIRARQESLKFKASHLENEISSNIILKENL